MLEDTDSLDGAHIIINIFDRIQMMTKTQEQNQMMKIMISRKQTRQVSDFMTNN